MSSFYASQLQHALSKGNSVYDSHQDTNLPNYNNDYKKRYQEYRNSIQQKNNNNSWMMCSNSQDLMRQGHVDIYEVRFKCTQAYYVLEHSLSVNHGDVVKVEADRGFDVGVVHKKKDIFESPMVEIPNKRIIGHVTPEELSILPRKLSEEREIVKICRHMASQKGLAITIADVEFQFDRKKLTVVFSSSGRVDFRELVREMFAFFRVRIWMQKISPAEALALKQLAESDSGSMYDGHHEEGKVKDFYQYPLEPIQNEEEIQDKVEMTEAIQNFDNMFIRNGSSVDGSSVVKEFVPQVFNTPSSWTSNH